MTPSLAFVYGTLQVLHLVFGLFFALLIVCAIRGISLHVAELTRRNKPVPANPQAAIA